MQAPRARKPARKKKIEAKKPSAASARARKAKSAAPAVRKNAPRKFSVRPVAAPLSAPEAATSSPVVAVKPVAPVLPAASPKIPVAPKRMPWRALAAFFAFALAMSALGGFIINTVDAATFQGPSQAPPGGNIPITIWNRVSTTTRQTSAAVEIDGGGPAPATPVGISVGTNVLNLGSAAGGQNVMYGVAEFANMHASADYLLLLQTAVGAAYTNRLSVDRDGDLVANTLTSSSTTSALGGMSAGSSTLNLGSGAAGQNAMYAVAAYTQMHPTGDYLLKLQSFDTGVYTDRFTVNRDGAVKASGCFGKTFVGLTAAVWPGNVGSYYAADNRCNTDFPGSHVCRVEEMIESIQCSVAGDPVRTNGGNFAWINGGPPGDSAVNANDCVGWTSNGSSAYGRVWIFDNTTGGRGTLTGCNVGGGGLKFACCR